MIRASSAPLIGCIRVASSSLPWQRCIPQSNLLQSIARLKSDQFFLSTSAIRNPLQTSQCKMLQSCSRTVSFSRTSLSDIRTLSQQGICLIHTNNLPQHSIVTSKLSRPNVGQYLCRNSLFFPRQSCFSQGSLRFKSSRSWSQHGAWREKNKSVMLYVIAGAVLVCGFSYAAVPLYTVFCQATGLGGQATAGHDTEKVETMAPVKGRELVIRFNADTAASMRWNFRPQQSEVKVVPGETALAFYSAMNPTDKPIVGISTYNVVPFDAGQYFNKIQCFCFEEQRLNPHEQVDMPVFFYIDPEFDEDPKMQKVDDITLSYTFFESKEGLELPDPWARPE